MNIKKILYSILLLVALHITPAAAFIHSVWLDYDNVCNFKESFPIEAGDIVYFHSSLNVGDLLSIKTTVVNPAANSMNDRWYFLNHNNKKFSREYSKIFKTKIRIGLNPGWFQFEYLLLSIPTGNTVLFHITDTSYCHEVNQNIS
jgi:hypothetical protein